MRKVRKDSTREREREWKEEDEKKEVWTNKQDEKWRQLKWSH